MASFTLEKVHEVLLGAAETELGSGIISKVKVEIRANPDGMPILEGTVVLKRKPKFGVPLEKISSLTDVLRNSLGDDSDKVEIYVRFVTEAELAAQETQ